MTDLERFWKYVDIQSNGCWNWTGYIQPNGYSRFRLGNKKIMAHRFSYEIYKGKIPNKKEIDHLCHNRRCVNPAHLEAITHKENLSRSPTIYTININKTHCPQGHSYDGDNLYIDPKGFRHCKKCHNIRQNNYKRNF